MQATYISPLTDFGFKKLFGEEPNKDLLISFLNTLLPDIHQIQDLQYTKNEYQGISPLDRRAIFDLNCVSTRGERFIIELQKVKQAYFKDRSLYYSTFAIQEQAQRGDWDYRLSTVYTIGILDFVMDEQETEVLYHAQLKDQHNRVFFDKLNFIYIILPRFTKQAHELQSLQDKWLYTFCHLHQLEALPDSFHETVFTKLFAEAKLATFKPYDRQAYEESLKYYRDLKNSNDTAHREGHQEGLEEGLEQGRREGMEEGMEKGRQEAEKTTALRMLAKGYTVEDTADLTGLPIDVVSLLKTES
ncbi:MAG: Rpn family recombination-promoting nuclease/putative transposase [Thiolinea sp.]